MIVYGNLTESSIYLGHYKKAKDYCNKAIGLAKDLQCKTELWEWLVNYALI